MAKVMKKERLAALYETIAALQTPEECRQFFEDLCSTTELSAMEQRYQVAELLLQDKVYLDILSRTNASTSTISRVKRVLTDGTGVLPEAILAHAEKNRSTEENQ